MKDAESLEIGGQSVPRGVARDLRINISETYFGGNVFVPVSVVRGPAPGPVIFVTAAVHGDEVNGTGIIHDFMYSEPLDLLCGTVLLVPVVNVFGFESNERYTPDRRDLNRSFPGLANGSMAARMAYTIMEEIVLKCDYGLDLHTAAFQRLNYPNVRADLKNARVRELARAFGCALTVDGKGPEGSLRREACKAGVPTIILEAGEPFKIEPSVLELGIRGIQNVLRYFNMLRGNRVEPPYRSLIRKTSWVRAGMGGILRFTVNPGDFVEEGQILATIYSIFGVHRDYVRSSMDGIVLGVTTMPAVKPGEPVCHLAAPTRRLSSLRKEFERKAGGLEGRLRRDLASHHAITEAGQPPPVS